VTGTILGSAGGLLELGTALVWFRLLRLVRIPADRRLFYAAHAAAIVLGASGLAAGAGTVGAVLAGIGILGGATFLGLAAQSAQAPGDPAVTVGGRIIDFVLPDHEGHPFDLATLRGRPFLLKFFRGHW
jgi:hypothetical protein